MTAALQADVVVVGGGAAGLAAAVALGRSRRNVVVVDAGQPRNAPADGAHNVLGQEGVPPFELLAAACRRPPPRRRPRRRRGAGIVDPQRLQPGPSA